MDELAKLLYAEPDSHLTYERDRVRRAQRDGRELYRERGVLPWAAYEHGRPVAGWPTDSAFLAALNRWKDEAVQRPRDRETPSGEPVTLETMKRDAAECGLYIADPVGQ